MIIRPARPRDAAQIAEITNTIIRGTLITFTTTERSPEEIARDIDERGLAFQVAELDGRVVGYATYGSFRSGPGYAHSREHTILLAPEGRGRGTGRALIRALEEVARSQGVHVLVAGISAENPGAIAFHAAVGFQTVGRMPEVGHKWGRWLDLVLMQKILASE
ncbi:GNAT family N-acetyltransferase [Ruegeria arenilitoris]|uniref:N-acyltransferase YncA n=1 Tax=Ruegeria arenilitoris TaxID=1173585 RepID=A0A238L185_9RHOB|nr:GNAT family N-acetyltransferase [Ruegeria arenilitoris]SMX48086.1 N-acyltransferase YncA [Ruegeria arenilitoris]